MTDWVTDDQILRAHGPMLDAFRAMFQTDSTGVSDTVDAAIDASHRHVDRVLALDPAKISDEYERMFAAARKTGNNELAIANIELSDTHLAAWTGDAADQFKLQLSMMKTFCENQKDLLLNGLVGVYGAYVAAVAVRASYLGLLDGATAAANNVIAEEQQQEERTKIAVVADVVQGVLSFEPTRLASSVAGTVIEVGKDITDAELDDSGRDEVGASYHRAATRLIRSFAEGLRGIRTHFDNKRDAAAEPPELFTPLPGYCDVGSPDFSYDKFADSVHDPGPIGAEVEAERKKYADEQAGNDSEIDKRLNPGPGGDKGAV